MKTGPQKFENHLASVLVLVKSKLEEKLWVYLSETEDAVSSVLVQEKGFD